MLDKNVLRRLLFNFLLLFCILSIGNAYGFETRGQDCSKGQTKGTLLTEVNNSDSGLTRKLMKQIPVRNSIDRGIPYPRPFPQTQIDDISFGGAVLLTEADHCPGDFYVLECLVLGFDRNDGLPFFYDKVHLRLVFGTPEVDPG